MGQSTVKWCQPHCKHRQDVGVSEKNEMQIVTITSSQVTKLLNKYGNAWRRAVLASSSIKLVQCSQFSNFKTYLVGPLREQAKPCGKGKGLGFNKEPHQKVLNTEAKCCPTTWSGWRSTDAIVGAVWSEQFNLLNLAFLSLLRGYCFAIYLSKEC